MSPAPLPAQLLTAKKVFIANGGADALWVGRPAYGPIGGPPFSGGPDRAYNQFYSAMKAWGRYELVGSPADADLLFEIRFAAARDPHFRIAILDPKTHATLWTLTEYVESATRQENRDKNFDQALARIVGEVQTLMAPSMAPAGDSK